MKNLIQRQDACIARMLEPRTSERRAAKNRNAAIAVFRKQCATAGYEKDDIDLLAKDVREMYELEKNAVEYNDEVFDAKRELAELKRYEEESARNEFRTLVRCLDPYNGCL